MPDRIAGIVSQIEHVDGLVGGLEIASGTIELQRTLLNACAIEHEKGLVRRQVRRQVAIAADVHVLIQEVNCLVWLAGIERGAHGPRPLRVTRTALEGQDRDGSEDRSRR